jgi:hypothetical protein
LSKSANRRARAPQGSPHRCCGDVAERAVARVLEQLILAEVRDEHVGEAIVVVVRAGHAHRVPRSVELGALGDVGEGRVVIVVVEPARCARPVSCPAARRTEQDDVEEAVVVVVQERAAGAVGLRIQRSPREPLRCTKSIRKSS